MGAIALAVYSIYRELIEERWKKKMYINCSWIPRIIGMYIVFELILIWKGFWSGF